jgi:hypothetical protein
MTYDPYQPPPTRPFGVPPQYDAYQQSSAMQPYSGPPGPLPPKQYPASPVPYGYVQPPMVLQPAVQSSGYAVWALVMGLVGFFAGWCLLGSR